MLYKNGLYAFSFCKLQPQDAMRVKSGIDYDIANRLLLDPIPKTSAFLIAFWERKPAAK